MATTSPASASATNRFVAPNGNDSRDCTDPAHPCKTIQRAVDVAASGDRVYLAGGTYAGAEIDKSLLIHGSSQQSTVTGTGGNATFEVLGASVTFQNLDVSGNTSGIGISAIRSSITVDGSTVDSNSGGIYTALSSATISGSAIDRNDRYGLLNFGTGTTVTFRDSEVDSTTTGSGTGIGVDMTDGTVTASGTSFTGNAGPGVYLEGIGGVDGATGSFERSTLASNATGLAVGAAASATVDLSTIAGNRDQGIAADVNSQTVVRRSTVARNETHPSGPADERAEIFARAATSPPATSLELSATIVSGADSSADCAGTIIDGGYNLSSDAANSCNFSTARHDKVHADAKLGPLQDNGAAIDDMVPLPGSAAIDAIPLGAGGCDHTPDQNGTPRPQPAGGRCDIGAVEAPAQPLVLHPSSLPQAALDEAYRVQLSASGGAGAPYVFAVAKGTALPAGLHLSGTGLLSGTPTRAGTFTVAVVVDAATVKRYRLTVEASASPNGGGNPIANTGVPTARLSGLGAATIVLGLLLCLAARRSVRFARPRSHRPARSAQRADGG